AGTTLPPADTGRRQRTVWARRVRRPRDWGRSANVVDRLRIGIAGGGKIVASEHVPRFRAIDGVELVAVANTTPDSSERAAAALGVPRARRHWGELIDDPEIDAILIGT